MDGAQAVAVETVVNTRATNRESQQGRNSAKWGSAFFFFIPDTKQELFGMSEDHIELEGTVSTVLPGTMFRVKLDNQHEILAHLSGKMRKHFVRLTVGDRVRLEMSQYDLSKARITYRLR